MMNRKKLRKWTTFALASTLLAGLVSPAFEAHASSSLEDYQRRMLSEFNFDQNNFKDDISNRLFSPIDESQYPNVFTNSIKYNGYKPNGNPGVQQPLSNMTSTNESVLTTAFWMKLNQTGSQGIIPFSIGNYTLYQVEGRFGFNTFNHDVFGVDMARNNEWVHVIAVFNKGDITKNELYLNGVKQKLTTSTAPLNTTHITSATNWSDTSVVAMGGHPQFPLKEGSMIDEIQLLSGGVTAEDAKNLYSLSRVPELNVLQENNQAKLEWSVSTFNPNPFFKTSFETGEDIPTIPTDKFNTVSLPQGTAYNGLTSLQFEETINGQGNAIFYPATESNRSYVNFKERKYVPNGTPLSLSVKARATQNAKFEPRGIGGVSSMTVDFHERYGGKPKVFLEDAKAGSKVIKVSNINEIVYKPGIWVASRYIPVPRHEGPYYTYLEILSIDYANSTLTLKSGLAEDFKAGQVLQTHTNVTPISFPAQTIVGDNEWKNVNINTYVRDYDFYDTMIRGFALHLYAETAGTLEIDDLELSEASKVEVYRGEEVIYSGYESQFLDNKATDKNAPEAPELKQLEMLHGFGKVTLSKPNDKGTPYSYKIRSTTSDGMKTVFSADKKVTITSGIKGYSYLADDNPATTPNSDVNTTAEAFSLTNAERSKKFLHVRAVDNAGNAGDTIHIRISPPSLQAYPDSTGTFAQLDWKMTFDNESYEYKVYKRKKGTTEFQSISTFNQEGAKELKVLNLYPKMNKINGGNIAIPTQTFSTWKGETKTLPKSASLEKWMEEPNSENAKGYGKGLIDVESVDYDTFNQNPAAYLNKSNDEWNYDAVFFGTWDANAYQPDFSDVGYNLVSSFVSDGHGLLVGHDVIRFNYSLGGFDRLKNLLNVQTFGDIGTTPIQTSWSTSGKVVKLSKSGVMTKYPWDIGEIGSKLSIPATHTLSQVTYGDVWIDFANEPSKTDKSGKGEANFYLTTWNNTGMIQTGHSNGEATPDEQKILANTLFYLSQKTTATQLNDYSSVDDSKPEDIGEVSVQMKERNLFEASFMPVRDKGTTYEYFVEAIGSRTKSRYQSSIVEATIQSGLSGYGIEVSQSQVPSIGEVASKNPLLPFNVMANDKFFVHVKAIDAVGNQSVKTISYDSRMARLIVQPVSDKWTNGNVELKISSNQALGKVVSIRLPNGQIVPGDMASFVVSENGIYTFYGQDAFGQWVLGGYVVSTIDRTAPVVSLPNLPVEWMNKNVEVQMEAR